jgi:hypothetical protein
MKQSENKVTFAGLSSQSVRKRLKNSKIITSNLNLLCEEYFPHPKIEPLITRNDEQDCNNMIYQVQIGNKIAYEEDNKTDSNLTSEFQTLEIAMIGFFEEFFIGNDINLQINNMMENERLLIIVVTRQVKNPKGRRSSQKYFNDIIGSAIFLPCSNYNLLLLIGVTSMQLHNNESLSRNYSLGTFLLATIDQLTLVIHHEQLPIICQAQRDQSSYIFYKKNYFHNVTCNSTHVQNAIQKQPTLVDTRNSQLIWLQTIGPIFLMTGYWVINNTKSCAISKIFSVASKYFFRSDVNKSVTQNPLFNKVNIAICELFTWDCIQPYIHVKGPSITSKSTWTKDNVESIFQNEHGYHSVICEQLKNDTSLHSNCVFNIMAFSLLQNQKKWLLIRQFFSFINRCISKLPPNNKFFHLMNINEEHNNCAEIYQIGFSNHALRVYSHLRFDKKKLMEQELPPLSKKDIKQFLLDFTPTKQINIFKSISEIYLDETFPGDLEDFNIINTLFKCAICFINPQPIHDSSAEKLVQKWNINFSTPKLSDSLLADIKFDITYTPQIFIFHSNKQTYFILKCNKKRDISKLNEIEKFNYQHNHPTEIGNNIFDINYGTDKTNSIDKIIWVKAVIVYSQLDEVLKEKSIEWFILCEKEAKDDYLYKPIAEELLQEIMGEDGKNILSRWSRNFKKLFKLEKFIQKKSHDHAIDDKDPHLNSTDIQFGELLKPIPFYVNTSNETFYSKNAIGTISAIRYNNTTKKFSGLIKLPGGKSTKEPLSSCWLKENFPQEMIDNWMKKYSRNKIGYTNIPPGSTNNIPSHFIQNNNPEVKYLQKEEKTCAYDSFSSILFYLGHTKEADLLQTYKNVYYKSIFLTHPGQVLQSIIQFVTGSSTMNNFTSNYLCKKINSSFRVLQWRFIPGEFIFATLWTVDGDIGHAICICDNYIFDSNSPHAFDLNQQNLNLSCNGIFSNLHIGYLFHSRKGDKNEFLSKIHQNKLL